MLLPQVPPPRYYWNRTKGLLGNRTIFFHCMEKKSFKCKGRAVLIDVMKDGVISLALAKWMDRGGKEEENGEEDMEEEVEEVTLESYHNHASNETKEMVREKKKRK